MRVSIKRHGQEPLIFEAAATSNVIEIETSTGTFAIRENENGSLDINEITWRYLAVQPRTANGLNLAAIEPANFTTTATPE